MKNEVKYRKYECQLKKNDFQFFEKNMVFKILFQ